MGAGLACEPDAAVVAVGATDDRVASGELLREQQPHVGRLAGGDEERDRVGPRLPGEADPQQVLRDLLAGRVPDGVADVRDVRRRADGGDDLGCAVTHDAGAERAGVEHRAPVAQRQLHAAAARDRERRAGACAEHRAQQGWT
jgi:hypothetical protein